MPTLKKTLFLSHNSEDKPDVIKFANALELHPLARQHNLQVWLDKEELNNGSDFPDQLIDAIRLETCAFALYLSNSQYAPSNRKLNYHGEGIGISKPSIIVSSR